MSRKKIVAGNWKMNNTLDQGKELVEGIINGLPENHLSAEIIVAPTMISLALAKDWVSGSPIELAAQNCHQEKNGAYTGEVSAEMISAAGVNYVILGHSERREYFNESEALLTQKINAALNAGLKVIFCMGEPLEIREADKQNEWVANQLTSIYHLDQNQMKNIILAYEPIWAIGTGKTASSDQAQEMHAYIREQLLQKFGAEVAAQTRILYGGSVNASNAEELFSKPDVDGGLVGGASLKPNDFLAIIKAAK